MSNCERRKTLGDYLPVTVDSLIIAFGWSAKFGRVRGEGSLATFSHFSRGLRADEEQPQKLKAASGTLLTVAVAFCGLRWHTKCESEWDDMSHSRIPTFTTLCNWHAFLFAVHTFFQFPVLHIWLLRLVGCEVPRVVLVRPTINQAHDLWFRPRESIDASAISEGVSSQSLVAASRSAKHSVPIVESREKPSHLRRQNKQRIREYGKA
jgi:hypothetical protein